MTNDEVIKKLYLELRDLSLKIDDLEIFLKTNKFFKIQEENKFQARLLENQFSFMESYKETLIMRIANLKNQNKK